MLQMFAFSRCALVVRHWFEINLDDATMEHGARIELRELTRHPHRGTESAAQAIIADRPLWRADLFDRLGDPPGSFAAAHHHPWFDGPEPSPRAWDPAINAGPWTWLASQLDSLGRAASGTAWPLDAADAADLPRFAGQVVAAARGFAPQRCQSAEQCYRLTRDVRDTVLLMISCLEQPGLLDRAWVTPWVSGS